VEDEAHCLIDASIPAVDVDSKLLDEHPANLFTEEVVQISETRRSSSSFVERVCIKHS